MEWVMGIVPVILLLLGFGFAAGQFVQPDEFVREEVLLAIVSAAVATIRSVWISPAAPLRSPLLSTAAV